MTKKKWDPQLAEFDDYGDIVTFVAWAGKLLDKSEWIQFAKDQFQIWQKLGKNRYGFFNTIDCSKQLKKNNLIQTASIYDLQDAILGMYEMWKLTGDDNYQQELVTQFQQIKTILKRNRGWLPNIIITPTLLALPQTSSNPAVTGLIAEHAFLYAKDTNDKQYEELGHKLIRPWLNTKLWQHYLFSQGYNTYLPTFSIYKQTKFMKENSNMLYAMLEQPKQYQQEIKHIINKLQQSHYKSGFYGCWYDAKTGKPIINKKIDKTQNFTVIDAYTCIYRYLKDKKYLKSAQDLTDQWIKTTNPKTELSPDYLTPQGKTKYHIAKLDQTVDLLSSFLRIYMETKDNKLLEQVNKSAIAVDKYFGQTDWWYRIVDTNTGEKAKDKDTPQQDRPTSINLTKYIGGALRFYCMLYAVTNDQNINEIHLMSRDR